MKLFRKKAHLVDEGLQFILAIKKSFNLGSNDATREAFSDIIAIPRPLVETSVAPNPEWIAGFTSGNGPFYVGIFESGTRLNSSVSLEFKLT